MGEAYLEYAPKLVCLPLASAGMAGLTFVGLQILRVQPRLRQQHPVHQDLGEARLQRPWPYSWRRETGQQRRAGGCAGFWEELQ